MVFLSSLSASNCAVFFISLCPGRKARILSDCDDSQWRMAFAIASSIESVAFRG